MARPAASSAAGLGGARRRADWRAGGAERGLPGARGAALGGGLRPGGGGGLAAAGAGPGAGLVAAPAAATPTPPHPAGCVSLILSRRRRQAAAGTDAVRPNTSA